MGASPCFAPCGKPSCERLGCVRVYDDERASGSQDAAPVPGSTASGVTSATVRLLQDIAALYVETGGAYWNQPGVDPWDEVRDARLYDGPYPVVAHPPCARWCSLAFVNRAMHGYEIGDDGGCFEAALNAVRTYGGVLEHPANSIAWKHYGLPKPVRGGWTLSLEDPGWATEVSQVAYGHRARKRTWLYYIGAVEPPAVEWRDGEGECIVGDLWHGNGRRLGRGDRPRMYQREALATPEAFRDVLIAMARTSVSTREERT